MNPVGMLSTGNLGVPLYMVIAFVALISLCLLFSRVQVGFAISFLFVFYIGYLYNTIIT